MRYLLMSAVLCFATLPGCKRSAPLEETLELPSESIKELEQTVGYEPGPWRYSPQKLSLVRLSARHILVSHNQVSGALYFFGALMRPTAARSRDEALRLSVAISRRLAKDPDAFELLAQRHSDDRISAMNGGALGVISATSVPPQIVDALGALIPGAISRIVESSLGFHVLQRLQVPPEEHVSYARLLVGHRDSWGPLSSTGRERSRQLAFERAMQIADDLRDNPNRFPELIKRYSDGADAQRGGDQGAWGTYESGAPGILLEVVRRLKPGAVSEVIETAAGFEILRRTPERNRTRYSLTEITIPHKEAPVPVAGVALSQAQAKDLADRIMHTLRQGDDFDKTVQALCQESSCQVLTRTETEGRGTPELEQALLQLAPGSLAQEVIASPVGYHVVRRDPLVEVNQPPAQVQFELPGPPRIEELIQSSQGRELGAATRRVGREAVAALALSDPRVLTLFEELADHFEQGDPSDRIHRLTEARAKLRELLGDETSRRVAAFVQGGLLGARSQAPKQAWSFDTASR